MHKNAAVTPTLAMRQVVARRPSRAACAGRPRARGGRPGDPRSQIWRNNSPTPQRTPANLTPGNKDGRGKNRADEAAAVRVFGVLAAVWSQAAEAECNAPSKMHFLRLFKGV